MPIDLPGLLEARRADELQLFDSSSRCATGAHLRTLGCDLDYVRAQGPHLLDAAGNR
jgi:hypothetical protein